RSLPAALPICRLAVPDVCAGTVALHVPAYVAGHPAGGAVEHLARFVPALAHAFTPSVGRHRTPVAHPAMTPTGSPESPWTRGSWGHGRNAPASVAHRRGSGGVPCAERRSLAGRRRVDVVDQA